VACDINPRIDYWSIGCILYEALTMIPLFAKQNERDLLFKQLRFIEIPLDKINYNCPLVHSLWNYKIKKWRFKVEKKSLFDYLNLVLKSKYINRMLHERDWIFDTTNGYYSLIKMCISDHYNVNKNDYVKQLENVETKYKSESKFPAIATV
jgi:serine/threonine protein kinase